MCRRFALATPIETLRALYRFDGGVAYPPRLAIDPGEPIGIVRLKPGIEATGRRELALVRWGLIPHWVKDPATFGTLANARAETILDKPSFRTPMRHRRCVVPADGWTVWTGKAPNKLSHTIRAGDAGPLAFAALWDHWLSADGSELETAAIVTTAASEHLRPLDERMPALLDAAGVDAWLDVRGCAPSAAVERLAARPPALDVTPAEHLSARWGGVTGGRAPQP